MLGSQRHSTNGSSLLKESIIRVSRRPIMNPLEFHLLNGPVPWQRRTKRGRWSRESYRKQEEMHEALIIPN